MFRPFTAIPFELLIRVHFGKNRANKLRGTNRFCPLVGQNNSAVNRRTRYYRLIVRFVPIVNEFESILIDRSLNFDCFPTIICNATFHCLLLPEKTFRIECKQGLLDRPFFLRSLLRLEPYKNLSRNPWCSCSYWSVWKGYTWCNLGVVSLSKEIWKLVGERDWG